MSTATTIPTQIRIETATKRQATALFRELGTDMSSAVNMFLKQCILRNGIPFKVEKPRYSAELMDAVAEAKQLLKDPKVERYDTFEEYQAAMQELVNEDE